MSADSRSSRRTSGLCTSSVADDGKPLQPDTLGLLQFRVRLRPTVACDAARTAPADSNRRLPGFGHGVDREAVEAEPVAGDPCNRNAPATGTVLFVVKLYPSSAAVIGFITRNRLRSRD